MREDSGLLLDYYALTMGAVYCRYKAGAVATFDLFVRNLPPQRNFLVACGIAAALDYLERFSFSRSDVEYLRQFSFSSSFLRRLPEVRFRGDVWAVPEGSLVFAEEPILRVTAPLLEAQLVEAYLLNLINVQTTLASKAARVVLAAGDKPVYDFSLRRTQGADAAMHAALVSYLAGGAGTSNVLAGKQYGIPVVGTMAHSYVMSFNDERESFRAYARMFAEHTVLLIDTYDYARGIAHAVTVAHELLRNGQRLLAVRLDSGDPAVESRKIRRILDREGLPFVKILVSGNLDEYAVSRLRADGAPIDSFGVGTQMGVSADAPYTDVIYKISEISGAGGTFIPTMKCSAKKHTLPGRKQVFRFTDRRGVYAYDVVGMQDEAIGGRPLLQPVMVKGRRRQAPVPVAETRAFIAQELSRLPASLRDLKSPRPYAVKKSARLRRLMRSLERRMCPLPEQDRMRKRGEGDGKKEKSRSSV